MRNTHITVLADGGYASGPTEKRVHGWRWVEVEGREKTQADAIIAGAPDEAKIAAAKRAGFSFLYSRRTEQ